MHKNILTVVGITILFLGTCITPSVAIDNVKKSSIPTSNGKTLYVGGSGEGNYTFIQEAINNASYGDTVFVFNGTYNENVLVEKSISLVGENKDTAVINGFNKNVVFVHADWVNISGFTITNGWDGLYIYHSCNNYITDNIINNNIYSGIRGIEFCNNTISGNNINYNNIEGICLGYLCNNNSIIDNIIYSNKWYGISSWSCNNNTITNNIINSNKQDGISLNGSNNSITCNTISLNIRYGIHLWEFSSNNTIYHNNFTKNSENALDECNNTWDDGYPSGGNYWDDYKGEDNDGDGIGDTPYTIPGGNNSDRYPLMYPWGNNLPYAPSNYYPCDEMSIDVDVNLSWDGGDPNPEDNVTYDVYFNNSYPPPLVATVGPYPANKTRIEYNPNTLENCTEYYWKIVAWDNHGQSTQGPICSFITICENQPPYPPTIEGPTRGKKGVSYNFTFNSIDPDGDNVYYFIKWGDGCEEEWDGHHPSGVDVVFAHSFPFKKTFTIEAKAKDIYDAESYWSYFDIEIPRTRASSYLWIEWLFEHFPMLEKLLSLLFVK